MQLLYAQNKETSKKQICLKYSARLVPQTCKNIALNHVSLPQHPQTSLPTPSPSKNPAFNLLSLSLPTFISTSPSSTSHTPPSTHENSPSYPQNIFNPTINHAHFQFCARIDDLPPLHVCSICKESYPKYENKVLPW